MNPFVLRRLEALSLRSSALDVAGAVAATDGHVLDPGHVAQRLDELATDLRTRLTDRVGCQAQATALIEALRHSAGLLGTRDEFHHPESSYLDLVLTRKRGIPISLALAYIEVGRRAGIRVDGVNFPGHFLVVVRDEGDDRAGVLIDPFAGELLTRDDCASRLRTLFGAEARLQPEHLAVASAPDIAIRMFGNLKAIRLNEQQWDQALTLCNAILTLAPRRIGELAERAGILERMDCFDAAIQDLTRLREFASDDEVRADIDKKMEELRARSKPIVH